MRLILITGLAAILVPSSRPAQSLVGSWNYFGSDSGDEMGDVVRWAGRVAFTDGYDDIVVGAPGDTLDVGKEGVVYVFSGGPQGLGDDPYWTAAGGQQGAEFGAAVDGAGDVDNDGSDDLIVGAWHYRDNPEDSGTAQEGAVYLYCGPLNPLSPSVDWRFLGGRKESYIGLSVSRAGDVNDDGRDDVLVGARWFGDVSSVSAVSGAALLFYGADGCHLASEPDWVSLGEHEGARFGESLATAGDVNGDGISDVVIGAPGYDGEAGLDEGAVYVFYGHSGSGLSVEPDWVAYGGQADAHFGDAVASAGDVDGDGTDDIVVGAPGYDGRFENEGAAFVFYGASSPPYLDSRPAWMRSSGQMGSGFGIAVAGAGDVDGDGFDDVVVGADHYNRNEEGAAFIFYGSAKGLGRTPGWTARGEKASAAFGHSVSTTGNLRGDGSIGILAGAPLYKMNDKDPVGMAAAFYGPLVPTYYRAYLPLIRH